LGGARTRVFDYALPRRFLIEAELVTDRIGKGTECPDGRPISVGGVTIAAACILTLFQRLREASQN